MPIMPFIYSAIYVSIIGFLSLLVGSAIPRRWFHPDVFPYRSFAWEQEGRIYDHLGIRHWKDKLPDMSKIYANLIRKTVSGRPTAEEIQRQIAETCSAEMVHWALMLWSLPVLDIWAGTGGKVAYALCILGNLPFVLIQRYNRPRFRRMLLRLQKKEQEYFFEGAVLEEKV